MLIRPITDTDVAAVNALVSSVARERLYLASTEGFTVEQTRTYYDALRAAGGVALLALEQEETVGWIDIAPGPFEGLTHCGRLGMGVASHVRGRGVGRSLLERAIEEAFDRLDRVELEVFASNGRAERLYRRCGFVEEGRRRQARRIDGACDDILMFGLLRDAYRRTPVSSDLPRP